MANKKNPLKLMLLSSGAYFFTDKSQQQEQEKVPWLGDHTFVIYNQGPKSRYSSFCLSPKPDLPIISIVCRNTALFFQISKQMSSVYESN